MKVRVPVFSVPLLCLCLEAPPAQTSRATSSQPVTIGERVPDFEFDPLVAHDGRTRLSELIGQPVLLGGWRTHLVDGMHAAFEATALWKKYGEDGLVVIMEDRHPWRGEAAWAGRMSFWQQTGGFVPWLTSNPPEGRHRHLPIERTAPRDARSMVLIGVDGILLAEGSVEEIRQPKKRSDFRRRVQSLVAAEMKRRKRGWGEDKDARTARSLAFGKDQLAKAMATLEGADVGASAERIEAQDEIQRHFAARIKSLRFYLEQGRPGDAARGLKKLRRAAEGHQPWQQELDALGALLESDEVVSELALDRQLTALLRPVVSGKKKGVSADLLGALRVLAEENSANRVGARAARLDPFVAGVIGGVLGLRNDALEDSVAKYLAQKRRRR